MQTLDGAHCSIKIERPCDRVLIVKLTGRDVDEFGDAPLKQLETLFPLDGTFALFIDARDVQGASIDVSGRWAHWLGDHRERFAVVNMVTNSPFVRMTADFVRKFASLGDVMHIYGDASAFDEALQQSIARAERLH